MSLLSVALYLRHHLTKNALHKHLRILKIATDSNVKKLTSQHNLLSQYAHLKNEVTKIFLCPIKKCPAILTMQKNKNFPEENQPCGHKFRTNSTACFVMRMPIEKQIKYFIEHHGVLHENWDLNLRGGVQSGSCYRELREQGLIDDKTITVT